MKRLVILIILFATPFLLFSESTERVITGIKKPAQIPDPFAVVDVYGPERESIVDNSRIVISDVMRNKSYNAFTYVFTGNYYGSVMLKYTFYPLTCNPNLAEAEEEEIIPYTVTVSHESTTVSGRSVTTTKIPSGSGIAGDFNNYLYCLGEWVRYNNESSPVTVSVSGTSSQSITLNYDFHQNSTVEYKQGNKYREVTPYNYSVCPLWTRTGNASFVLKISEDGLSIPEDNSDPIRYTDGEYSCTVSVEIISGS